MKKERRKVGAGVVEWVDATTVRSPKMMRRGKAIRRSEEDKMRTIEGNMRKLVEKVIF